MIDDKDQTFDLSTKQPKHICNLCECNDVLAHNCYWNCPIFDKQKICAQCCMVDALQPDIEKKFSEKLGRPITKEEMYGVCKECGRNYAGQDPELARRLEFNDFKPTNDSHLAPDLPES